MNKWIFGSLLMANLISLGQTASAAVYNLDKAHMQVGFSVKHLMVSNVKGHFSTVNGTFEFDEKTKLLKNLQADIDVASVNTNEADRDKHLKGEDFFAAEKFPKMTFKSDKAKFKSVGKTTKVSGMLTIKDQTKPVVLDVVYNGSVEFMGTQKIGFTATTKINRKDFGITWNKSLDKGGVAVSDEVLITIEGEANMAVAKK